MPAPRTLYAKSGDVHLAYQAIGEGPRDVVLVLDWASHLEAVWEQPFVQEFITSLNRYARVLWFDMRGVGLSDRVVEDAVAPEEWMDDVCAVMDAAGSKQATLIAHGHGVQMALMSAATHPDRVASLVLINGFARFSHHDRTLRVAGRTYDPDRTSYPVRVHVFVNHLVFERFGFAGPLELKHQAFTKIARADARGLESLNDF